MDKRATGSGYHSLIDDFRRSPSRARSSDAAGSRGAARSPRRWSDVAPMVSTSGAASQKMLFATSGVTCSSRAAPPLRIRWCAARRPRQRSGMACGACASDRGARPRSAATGSAATAPRSSSRVAGCSSSGARTSSGSCSGSGRGDAKLGAQVRDAGRVAGVEGFREVPGAIAAGPVARGATPAKSRELCRCPSTGRRPVEPARERQHGSRAGSVEHQ